MSDSSTLGAETARLNCRKRYAYGSDLGHARSGYFVAPFLGGLLLTVVLYAAHTEGDVLNKLGLLHFASVGAIHLTAFLVATIGLYWYCFTAPNCPITICENGIKYKRRKLLFSEILGVRLGSGIVEDTSLEMSFTPIGRVCAAMNSAETAIQNVRSCSIFIVKSDFSEAIISKGLVMYEQQDLQELIETINERSARPTGVSLSYA